MPLLLLMLVSLHPVQAQGSQLQPKFDGLVRMEDMRIHSRVFGEGNHAVVLLSGLGSDQRYWDSIVQALASHTTVVTYGRPGYGQSEQGTQPRTAGPYVVIEAIMNVVKEVRGR